MAQPPKPLDYPISKIVMEHVRANKRYLLAACCPALRNLHAQVPLKIDHLILDKHGFTVDNVPHTLHTFVSNLNQIPRAWQVDIPPRGLNYDIDRFGFRHVDDAIEGDIMIQDYLVKCEAYFRPEVDFLFLPAYRTRVENETRRAHIRRQKERARRARRRVRVHTYLQYTLMTPVRYPEGIQLAEALRTLIRNFFAASEISVNVLEIPFTFGVLRLPKGLRFDVVSLKTGLCSAEVLNAISPIIRDPLQKLDIGVLIREDPIFDHEIMQTLPFLSISFYAMGLWHFPLIRIGVPNVEVMGYYDEYALISGVGGHWIDNPRPIGHKMSLEFSYIGHEFETVRNHLGTTRGTMLHENLPPEYPYCGFMHVNWEKDFVIYMQRTDQNEMEPRWSLVMEMMSVGSVEALEEGEA